MVANDIDLIFKGHYRTARNRGGSDIKLVYIKLAVTSIHTIVNDVHVVYVPNALITSTVTSSKSKNHGVCS